MDKRLQKLTEKKPQNHVKKIHLDLNDLDLKKNRGKKKSSKTLDLNIGNLKMIFFLPHVSEKKKMDPWGILHFFFQKKKCKDSSTF